jgi:HAD superfamily hydrolase (TIGR01509 family)
MPLSPPKFLYFDLGMVLVTFSVERMCRQMAEVAGLEPERVHAVVFDGDLQLQYERGTLSTREFYDAFCRETRTQVPLERLCTAASDIFEINAPMLPVVAQLTQARWRMGILSNTCACHWEHCRRRYRIVQDSFCRYALSYELGCAKPEPAIFRKAAALAGVAPEEIFYTDDIAGHVAGAQAAGFDAVQFTGPESLVAELRRRGVDLAY